MLATRISIFPLSFANSQKGTNVHVLGAKFINKLGRAVSHLKKLGEEVGRYFRSAEDR